MRILKFNCRQYYDQFVSEKVCEDTGKGRKREYFSVVSRTYIDELPTINPDGQRRGTGP